MYMRWIDRCTCLLIDSGDGWFGDPEKRDSFFRFGEPEGLLYSKDGVVTVRTRKERMETKRHPLSVLEGCLGDGYLAAGYIGYEYSAYTDSGFTPSYLKDSKWYPDMMFLLFWEEGISTGHSGALKFNSDYERVYSGGSMQSEDTGDEFTSNMSREEYIGMVERAKKYIKYGEIYQVNLSQRFIILQVAAY